MNCQHQNSKRIRQSSLLPFALAGLIVATAAAQPIERPTDEVLAPEPLAEIGADDGSEEPSPLVSLRRARDTLIGIADFNAALNPALAAVNSQDANPDPSYTDDLTALARIQAELGEFETAETNYLKAIDLVEAAEGEFSITLVEPYRGLGRSYIKSARYPEAITALEQAQHVSQRNLGLFNVEQAALIDDITTAYLGIGDTIEARRMQLERLDNAIKRFGADDERVIPFRYQLADYYQRSRMTLSAREQYEEVLKSQETKLGTAHPDLLGPLRQLVKVDLLMAQVEKPEAYSRLVGVLEQNRDVDPVERGLSLAVLGDWATVGADPVAARDYYRQAWDALSAKQDVDVAQYFATPVMIDFIAPLNSVDRGARSKAYAWGSITFEFDLSADGRPYNVETVGDAALGQLQTRYNRRLRETHFRPRLVAGEPVATDNVQFTHYFRYYVDDEG